MSIQDYHDPLQVLDHVVSFLDDNKAELGIRYIAQQDERLAPEYPAALVELLSVTRQEHATRMFLVTFAIDIWILHAKLTERKSVRSRKDIELATGVRKLLHSEFTLNGHIVFGHVTGEFSTISPRVMGAKSEAVVATRLTWEGQNRVLYKES